MAADDEQAELAILNQVVNEILSRNGIQYQISLAALAGLGIIASQLKNIQDAKLPVLYLAVTIVYMLIGLLQLEQDRLIALLGAKRQRLERATLAGSANPTSAAGDPPRNEGWEDFRRRTSPLGTARVFANSTRYILTFGAAIAFLIAFLYNASDNRYTAAKYAMFSVLPLLILVGITMGIEIARASRQSLPV
jgi:hypothetical protein